MVKKTEPTVTVPNGFEPKTATRDPGPNIGYIRQEVGNLTYKWDLVRDCLIGQKAVKDKGLGYLPMPNADDQSPENKTRYVGYKERAVFYNVTRRTIDGLVGQVFSRDPLVAIEDESMKGMIADVDGCGVSLDQHAKKSLGTILSYGRCGLLVDYPVTNGPTSLAEQEAGYIRPTIGFYGTYSIINWRTAARGAKQVLTLVVLNEQALTNDDGFEVSVKNRWRVLKLITGVDAAGLPLDRYVVQTWQQDEDSKDGPFYVMENEWMPLDAEGKPLSEIPFYPIGVLNNDINPDEPPLYDLAVLNIAHYRNSADYEDACYMLGQPTPYFAGLTQNWVEKVWKGVIRIGSRAVIAMPAGGTAGLLQVTPNTMPFEAMKHKEAQMTALGAKLIEQNNVQQTLGESQLDESSESSVLSTSAKNVSDAYQAALRFAAKLIGISPDAVTYSLNTDFPASRLTPNERNQLMLEWQAGAITRTEMRAGMRKAGVASLDLAAYKAEIASDPPPDQVAAEQASALAEKQMANRGKGGSDNAPAKQADAGNNDGNQSGN